MVFLGAILSRHAGFEIFAVDFFVTGKASVFFSDMLNLMDLKLFLFKCVLYKA